jgi:hypothetical protein
MGSPVAGGVIAGAIVGGAFAAPYGPGYCGAPPPVAYGSAADDVLGYSMQ